MNTTLIYRPEFCELLIEHMAEGKSFATFGLVCKAGVSTMYEWVEKYPEFKHAKEMAFLAAQDWYEERLRAKNLGHYGELNPKLIDTSTLIFALKTRFHKTYGDKQDVKIEGAISITIDEDDANL